MKKYVVLALSFIFCLPAHALSLKLMPKHSIKTQDVKADKKKIHKGYLGGTVATATVSAIGAICLALSVKERVQFDRWVNEPNKKIKNDNYRGYTSYKETVNGKQFEIIEQWYIDRNHKYLNENIKISAAVLVPSLVGFAYCLKNLKYKTLNKER